MRDYTADKYEDLVAKTENKKLQAFMAGEINFIKTIDTSNEKTFIDLGAGYGRVVPELAKVGHSVIAVEINPEMFKRLELIAAGLPNAQAIQGDFMKLSELLPENITNPVLLILQNSLGTIENGTSDQAMKLISAQARKMNARLIIGLFRQQALSGFGRQMYASLEPMLGHIDENKTDFSKGIFVTDSGYISKWWTDEEILSFKKLGKLVRSFQAEEYVLLDLDMG